MKIKSAYILWCSEYQKLPKTHRYTLGQKTDTLFVELIEAVAIATFLSREEKQPWVRLAIRKLDTAKVLILILWETRSFNDKAYIRLSLPLDEIGRMLGGWNGQLAKSASSSSSAR